MAKDFVGNEKFVVFLGDNILQDNIGDAVKEFKNSDTECMLFLKEVSDAHRFGVAELDTNNTIKSIEEKPKKPKSNLAVVGVYMYGPEVFDFIETLKPSSRGELEITDVNNWYVSRGKSKAIMLNGFWSDAGTVESLYRTTSFLKEYMSDESSK